ncbi:MAG: hypothetical protein ACW96M_08525, partial [Candidatus Thorarchaeota archaeon]
MAAQDPSESTRKVADGGSIRGRPSQDIFNVWDVIATILGRGLDTLLFELSDLRGSWQDRTGASGLTEDSKAILAVISRVRTDFLNSEILGPVLKSKIEAIATEISALRQEWLDHPPITEDSAVAHDWLVGLNDDDHTQYHTDARGDARYYKETELTHVSGATLIGHYTDPISGLQSVADYLNLITMDWVFEPPTISEEGGLNIQWSAGSVYHSADTEVHYFDARETNYALTDDAVNYLYSIGTSTLQVSTTKPDPDSDEIEIAHVDVADGIIFGVHIESGIGEALSKTLQSLENAFPVIVTSGLIVSEDTDATNALDVAQTAGNYIEDMHELISTSQILSRNTPMRRWWKDGAGTDYTSDTNAEIDTTQYDNGGTLTAI